MKKVKIMLTAVAVLAVVGGALAFKATKFTSSFCTKSGASTGACTSYVLNSVEDPSGVKIAAFPTSDTRQCSQATCNPRFLIHD